jgi:hypothetical protein
MPPDSAPALPGACGKNPRAGERFGLALPITMEGMQGMEGETHDISESGILFETDAQPEVGSRIDLTLRYNLDGQDFLHRCQVQVVRVERVGAKSNVAARLLSPLV